MNLDITKYLKNKDITISNDDLDLDKMSKDLYKGYTKNSDIKEPDYSGYVKKEDKWEMVKYEELKKYIEEKKKDVLIYQIDFNGLNDECVDIGKVISFNIKHK